MLIWFRWCCCLSSWSCSIRLAAIRVAQRGKIHGAANAPRRSMRDSSCADFYLARGLWVALSRCLHRASGSISRRRRLVRVLIHHQHLDESCLSAPAIGVGGPEAALDPSSRDLHLRLAENPNGHERTDIVDSGRSCGFSSI